MDKHALAMFDANEMTIFDAISSAVNQLSYNSSKLRKDS